MSIGALSLEKKCFFFFFSKKFSLNQHLCLAQFSVGRVSSQWVGQWSVADLWKIHCRFVFTLTLWRRYIVIMVTVHISVCALVHNFLASTSFSATAQLFDIKSEALFLSAISWDQVLDCIDLPVGVFLSFILPYDYWEQAVS